MHVNIAKITNTMSKVSAIVADLKTIPGVLLDLADNTLKVCFSDGHKSLIEEISVEMDEGDHVGGVVVGYEQLMRAISNCQPSGIIKVSEVVFTYKQGNILTISADQSLELRDSEGKVTGSKKMASKKMDLAWTEPGSDMKSAILSRMKYADIFEHVTAEGAEIQVDTFDKKELIDALAKTSVEKGKQIYISTKTQNIFVANQVHLTSVPISGYEISDDIKSGIASSLRAAGTYTDEAFAKECANRESRIHFSVSMSQPIAKAVMDILNKTASETVYLYTKDKFCNIYINNEDEEDGEKVGIWFEMTPASKAHLSSFEKYSALEYKCYNIMFIREFLNDMIKSALGATKSEKIEVKFVPTSNENPSSPLDMVIEGGSSANSTSDVYSINPDGIVDAAGDLQSKTFKISLKVINDMLSQLKTTRVAMDINIAPTDGSVCIRLTELNDEEFVKAFTEARQATKTLCESNGQPFEENSTPTPIEYKLSYLRRNSIMMTRQYTMLSM